MPSLAEILGSAAKFNSVEEMEEFVYSEHDNLSPEEQVSQEELEEFVAGIASVIEAQSTVFNPEYMDSILEKEEVPENKEDKLEAAYQFSRANIARYNPDETEIYINTHLKKHFKLTATETNSIIKAIKRENKNSKKQSFTQVSATKESGVKYGDNINSEVLDNWSEYITPAVDNGYYIIDNHGIIRVEERLGKDGDISEKFIDVCRSPFILCGISQPVNGTGTYYKLRFTTSKGYTKEAWVNHSDLITKKGINDQLVSLDINCPENGLQRETIEYVSRSIAEFSRFYKTEYSATQCGWNEDKTMFVLGNRAASKDGMAPMLNIGDSTGFEALEQRGTLEGWVNGARGIFNHEIIRFRAYDTMSAIVNYVLGLESHVTDMYGNTSVGKTFSAQVCLTMVGRMDKLTLSPKSTKNGIFVTVRDYSDIPFLIDETTGEEDKIKDVVYQVIGGIAKMKSTQDGHRDGGEVYRTTCMTTGENMLRDSLDNAGQMYRVVELKADIPVMKTREVELIKKETSENCGHVIDLFLAKVFEKKENKTLCKMYDTCLGELPDTIDNVQGRSKSVFAGIMVAGKILEEVFAEIGIAPMDAKEVVNKYFTLCVKERPVEMEWVRALRLVNDWVNIEYRNFAICPKSGTVTNEGIKRCGYIDEDYIDIIGSALTQKLKENGMKPTKLKKIGLQTRLLSQKTRQGI